MDAMEIHTIPVYPYRVDWDSVDFHGIHGTAKMCGFPWALAKPGTSPSTEGQGSLHPWHGLRLGGYAWALASPGSIRVDLDSVGFHGIHGTAKICGFPWALAKPGTSPNTDSDWVDMRGHWQALDSVDFHGIHMALSPTGWICMEG